MKPAESPKQRFAQILDHLASIKDTLSDDVERIELDVFYSDGVRAKVEIRDLGKN